MICKIKLIDKNHYNPRLNPYLSVTNSSNFYKSLILSSSIGNKEIFGGSFSN